MLLQRRYLLLLERGRTRSVRRVGPLIRRGRIKPSINILRWLFCFIPQEGRNLPRRLTTGAAVPTEGRGRGVARGTGAPRTGSRDRSEEGGNYFDARGSNYIPANPTCHATPRASPPSNIPGAPLSPPPSPCRLFKFRKSSASVSPPASGCRPWTALEKLGR